MKRIRFITIICTLVLAAGLLVLPALPAGAVNVVNKSCEFEPYSAICEGQNEQIQPIIKTVVNVLLFIAGIIAILMTILGAIRYTLSSGEAKALTDAKNTILYSVIGLAVAFSAYATINWVVDIFGKT